MDEADRNAEAGEPPALEINIAHVLEAVSAAVDLYEKALVSNDVETLDALFWNSPHTVRYGATECLYGHDEILAFRKARDGGNVARTVTRRSITTYGERFATASLEFTREGEARIGRQSQSWALLDGRWRVVNAHVSWMA